MSKGVEKNKNGDVGKTYEFDPYLREQKKVTWGNFFYDSSNGAVFGRTGKSWGKNFFFYYFIFFIILCQTHVISVYIRRQNSYLICTLMRSKYLLFIGFVHILL